jgi:hypothetical protein
MQWAQYTSEESKNRYHIDLTKSAIRYAMLKQMYGYDSIIDLWEQDIFELFIDVSAKVRVFEELPASQLLR